MTRPVPFRQILAAATLLASPPAHADGNRLLPFWGQPYPYGYAWREAEPLPDAVRPCAEGARPGRRRVGGAARRCAVVLHARD